jgi:nitroreductase
MLRKATVTIILIFIGIIMKAQSSGKNVTDVILSGYSAKVFTSDPVSDNDIETILKCGIKSPSGMNKQPWKFTVVKDNALVTELVKSANQGNILIVVSGVESAQTGQTPDFDCALATENMYVAAQGLGLGAHIYVTGVSEINKSKKPTLGIPDGYKAVAILRIGHITTSADATSSASTRKKFEEVVNYK